MNLWKTMLDVLKTPAEAFDQALHANEAVNIQILTDNANALGGNVVAAAEAFMDAEAAKNLEVNFVYQIVKGNLQALLAKYEPAGVADIPALYADLLGWVDAEVLRL